MLTWPPSSARAERVRSSGTRSENAADGRLSFLSTDKANSHVDAHGVLRWKSKVGALVLRLRLFLLLDEDARQPARGFSSELHSSSCSWMLRVALPDGWISPLLTAVGVCRREGLPAAAPCSLHTERTCRLQVRCFSYRLFTLRRGDAASLRCLDLHKRDNACLEPPSFKHRKMKIRMSF